jgi:hypothetical protein
MAVYTGKALLQILPLRVRARRLAGEHLRSRVQTAGRLGPWTNFKLQGNAGWLLERVRRFTSISCSCCMASSRFLLWREGPGSYPGPSCCVSPSLAGLWPPSREEAEGRRQTDNQSQVKIDGSTRLPSQRTMQNRSAVRIPSLPVLGCRFTFCWLTLARVSDERHKPMENRQPTAKAVNEIDQT